MTRPFRFEPTRRFFDDASHWVVLDAVGDQVTLRTREVAVDFAPRTSVVLTAVLGWVIAVALLAGGRPKIHLEEARAALEAAVCAVLFFSFAPLGADAVRGLVLG
jgi:hypothetical protein